ncbi:MAG: hypothetical protein LQ348_005088 [Seirophora lacunosa]|nr:MAG: hypothetical protein LQ348_005088 [Seirophora lacunosa]
MWEVDPETKTKLLALQKHPGNTTCCDCAAPSPQWASPKFGTFICLTCAGLHRGLGVHISFVRSITMDAFKGNEIARMQRGGNERWKRFWAERNNNNGGGGGGGAWQSLPSELKAFEEVYGGEVGEEWKERLTCEVEGREFLGVQPKKKNAAAAAVRETVEASEGMTGRSRKEMNEDFFTRKGGENERRREDLPPSLGGKYAGFGSESAAAPTTTKTTASSSGEGIPGVDEFQKDPVAALTKGFGWFTTTVGKGAKSVNDGWVKPNVQKLAEADLATQARLTAAQVAQNIQSGSKTAAEQFNRFVEDSSSSAPPSSSSSHHNHPPASSSRSKPAPEPDHRDFWDSFGSPVVGDGGGGGGGSGGGKPPAATRNNAGGRTHSPVKQQQQGRGASPAPPGTKGNAIGTAAMRKGVVGKEKSKEEDQWDEF